MLLRKKELSARIIFGIIVIFILIIRLAYHAYNKTRGVFYKEYRLQ
ncbi:MAG TPA: hypothetical protein PLQ81_02105 [bacterium]|nr:hypothetical protein [bacterium]